MKKLVVIESCQECPYYDNEYYHFSKTCEKLWKQTDPTDIPDDCPLPTLHKDPIEENTKLKELIIWMTGCGYDFKQHDYFNKQMKELL